MPTPLRALLRTIAVLVALAAIAAAVASVADAHWKPPLRSSDSVELEIYDSYVSRLCGVDVFANVAGTETRNVFLGDDPSSPAREVSTFEGKITWFVRDTAASYSDRLASVLHIVYPEGIELLKPARVTVTGRHGGTFPIGGGPAGYGLLVYDATVYAEDQGFPYWFVNGDPIVKLGTFDSTPKRICAALT